MFSIKRSKTKTKFATSRASVKKHSSAIYLIIVESPSKCHKIEEYLGADYQCIASKGHIQTIDGLRAIKTKDKFQITFSPIEEKKNHIEAMRSIIGQFPKENILLATDDDREGEAISWHICEVFGLPIATTKRILFHEITKQAILQALENPTTINMSLVYAQHARQVLDIIVGFKISPFLWKHISNNKSNGLSAGRCQTPALRLIYDNHLSANGEYDTKYKTYGYFFQKSIKFELTYDFIKENELVEFLELSKIHHHMLSIQPSKETTKQPPRPFTTSKLLQTASAICHYSPKMTMDLCQQLYQMGLITYMRTDSTKYSPIFLKHATDYILYEYTKPEYVGNLKVLENQDATNPHEAIRVTNLHQMFLSDTNRALCTMYRLIWKNTVESCMSIARYQSTEIRITSPNKAYYTHMIDIPTFLGWKIVGTTKRDENDIEAEASVSADIVSGLLFYIRSFLGDKKEAKVDYQYIESVITIQHKHSHYTEASLIQKLEELGIGRPSTYSMIVETIQERGYVAKTNIKGITLKCNEYKLRNPQFSANIKSENSLERIKKEKVFGEEKNKLVIQNTGILALEFLIKHFESLFSYDYTKQMEIHLDEITEKENASEEWYLLCRDCTNEIKRLIQPLSKVTKQTYPIDAEYELVFHQYGASLRKRLEDGSFEYKSIRKDIQLDLDRLRSSTEPKAELNNLSPENEVRKSLKDNFYTFDELVEIKNDHLGVYENMNVYLKSGKFGLYVECGENKISLQNIGKTGDMITIEDVLPYIKAKMGREEDALDDLLKSIPSGYGKDVYDESKKTVASSQNSNAIANKNILRILTPNLSIRKGKYGAYVYYKKPEMKEPQFFNLKKFKEGFNTCDKETLIAWIRDTYKISI